MFEMKVGSGVIKNLEGQGVETKADFYVPIFDQESKIAILHTSSKIENSMSNKCYSCQNRENIPGNAHSRCSKKGGVTIFAKKHGFDNGWFSFPFNFDPVWIVACNGFDETEKPVIAS